MKRIVGVVWRWATWPFDRGDEAGIHAIDATAMESIIRHLESTGWRQTSRYGGFDAGIDYDCIRLKRRGVRLKCEWNHDDGWRIAGPREAVDALAAELGFRAVARRARAGTET